MFKRKTRASSSPVGMEADAQQPLLLGGGGRQAHHTREGQGLSNMVGEQPPSEQYSEQYFVPVGGAGGEGGGYGAMPAPSANAGWVVDLSIAVPPPESPERTINSLSPDQQQALLMSPDGIPVCGSEVSAKDVPDNLKDPDNYHKATVTSGIINLTNTTLGSGTLAMSYCIRLCGLPLFVVMLVGSGMAAHYGVFMLFRACEHLALPRSTKYADLGEAVYGRRGRLAVQWSIGLGLLSVGMMPVAVVHTFTVSSRTIPSPRFSSPIARSLTGNRPASPPPFFYHRRFVVIVGDVLQPVFGLTGNKFACVRWEMTATLILCVALPLTLLPTMDSLKFTSVTSLTCIIGYAIFVIISAGLIVGHPEHPTDCYEDAYKACLKSKEDTDVCMVGRLAAFAAAHDGKHCTHGWRNDFYDNMLGVTVCGEAQVSPHGTPDRPGDHVSFAPVGAALLNALPIIFTAFFNHPNVFPISKELAERSTKTVCKISRATCTICGTVYFLVGLAGYFAFLDATDSDLLLNFAVRAHFKDSRDTLTQVMNVLRVGFGISFLLTFPLICWEVRATLDKIIFGDREYVSYPRTPPLRMTGLH